jgi:ribosomal protein S27AE
MKRQTSNKAYNTSIIFVESIIAPCGMNCGTCIAYMRPKNKCPGCWADDKTKHKACVQCIIKNCNNLKNTESKFCYDCAEYPCKRLRQLDKRYQTRYKTSFLENLMMIKHNGIDSFLDFETKRRRCPNCGSTLSVHRDHCLVCLTLK